MFDTLLKKVVEERESGCTFWWGGVDLKNRGRGGRPSLIDRQRGSGYLPRSFQEPPGFWASSPRVSRDSLPLGVEFTCEKMLYAGLRLAFLTSERNHSVGHA